MGRGPAFSSAPAGSTTADSSPAHPAQTAKGADHATESCLRSWLAQQYGGSVQILFGVASAEDPVCNLVRQLLREFPGADARLLVCGPLLGTNLKVSKLAEMERLAKYDLLVISDADVWAPPDFLAQVVRPLEDPAIGLVNCFYRMANPTTLAMKWEAVGVNADFWSQVLQSQSLKPLDFALGAVMATRRRQLEGIGGFATLANCLADDYQLGHRIARNGHRIAISPVVVECWSEPMGWGAVWRHQLRWARTIRVCQPAPYFFSILSNPSLWPLLWLAADRGKLALSLTAFGLLVRILVARDLQQRLTQKPPHLVHAWLVPARDLLHTAIWFLAFLGNRIEWRGESLRLRRDGTLMRTGRT